MRVAFAVLMLAAGGCNEVVGIHGLDRKDAGAGTMAIWFQAKGAPGADADGWFKVVEMTKTPKKK